MENVGKWIQSIIEDLVTPEKRLSDIILKVQVLAYKIKNEHLKAWVNNELNGYLGKDTTIPKYRIIPTAVFGNIIQQAGFNLITKNNTPLPVEALGIEVYKELMTMKLSSKIAELEYMASSDATHSQNLFLHYIRMFNKAMAPWQVDEAWQVVSKNTLEGVLSAIKSTLLNFLLELQSEFGDCDFNQLFDKKGSINEIFNKTIGTIQGTNVSVIVGADAQQVNNYAEKSNFNVAKGNNATQSFTVNSNQELINFLEDLKKNLQHLNLQEDDREDIESEITRIEVQLNKENPRQSIIKSSIDVIYNLLLGVTTNAISAPLLEQAQQLIQMFA